MEATMMDYPLTLTSILEYAERIYPGTELVSRSPDRSLFRSNYGALGRNARALAASLQQAGLARGDRVATLMWNPLSGCRSFTVRQTVGRTVFRLARNPGQC